MDDFDKQISELNIDRLKEHLSALQKPCYESELLKVLFSEINIVYENPLNLYRYHFLLFYILYRLQDEFYKENKYLHVHFMRTFLLDYPDNGFCRFYDEHSGSFCKNTCISNESYCDFHIDKIGILNLEQRSAKYFYFDKNNYYKIDEKSADDLINGSWEILSKYNDYKNSFKVLDLPESASIDIIKKQYKYLAKIYHPDHNNENQKKFTEINNAYRFLIKALSLKISS